MPVIKVFASLRRYLNPPTQLVGGSTVNEAVTELCNAYPGLHEKIFLDGKLRPFFIISLNGRHIDLSEGLNTPVQSADEIAIFPPIAGGYDV